jgi:hypothetical protein
MAGERHGHGMLCVNRTIFCPPGSPIRKIPKTKGRVNRMVRSGTVSVASKNHCGKITASLRTGNAAWLHSACGILERRWLMREEGRLLLRCDGTRAETRFRVSAKRTSPFNSAGASVQSTAGSRGVRISCSNAGYTMFRGSVRVLATHSIRQFPLHFPSRASPCAITFQLESTGMSVEFLGLKRILITALQLGFPQ